LKRELKVLEIVKREAIGTSRISIATVFIQFERCVLVMVIVQGCQ